MTWPLQGKTDLEPNFPHCVLGEGERHTVDHPSVHLFSLQREHLTSVSVQESGLGLGW